VIKKEAKIILKYENLTIDTQRMWNVKTTVIPVIRGANHNHLKVIQKTPEQRTGKTRSQVNTENKHIGHNAHVLRKAMMYS
jgi:hypothetical protein